MKFVKAKMMDMSRFQGNLNGLSAQRFDFRKMGAEGSPPKIYREREGLITWMVMEIALEDEVFVQLEDFFKENALTYEILGDETPDEEVREGIAQEVSDTDTEEDI